MTTTSSTSSTLYRRGNVHAAGRPDATALLVVDGDVAWIGTEATADALDADRTVDLDGALIAPAFVDAHVHVTETGLALSGLDLTGATGVRDVLDAVARAAATTPAGETILGHGWDDEGWPDRHAPTAAELDRAGGGRPVYLSRVDVHSAVISHELARRAGLAGSDGADGTGGVPGWGGDGRVERDAHHRARAVTRELAPSERRRVQLRALTAAAAAGIAVVHEMSAPHIAPPGDLAALMALAGDADLVLPEVVALHGELARDAVHARELVAATGVAVAGLGGDLCVDGAYGSRTAALHQDYADAPGHRGHLYLDETAVRDHVVACVGAGLRPGFHVIGDHATATVVAGLGAAAAAVGDAAIRAVRPRLEHLEAVTAQEARLLAGWGVQASVQPVFDAWWGGPNGTYAHRLGPARAAALNPFADLMRAGVPLALGSDAPVTPMQPWAAVRACVEHSEATQRISARAAFAAHTRGGHRAAGQEMQGVLAEGMPATFAVWHTGPLVVQTPDDRVAGWSTDPRSGTPALPELHPDLPLPTCRRTVVRGRIAWDAGDLDE